MHVMAAVVGLGSLLFIALSPVKAIASETHFLVINSSLHIFSADTDDLKEQCRHLQRYVEFHSRRNHRSFSYDADRCLNPQVFDLRDQQVRTTFPTYASAEEVKKSVGKSPGFILSVGDWFPSEIWGRYQDRPQDGVCYNSALVESGVLPESARSSFITTIEYFLGMQGLRELSFSGAQIVMNYGPRSDSPLIASRKTWEIDGKNKEGLRREIVRHIRSEFSPGSVLCVSIDDRESKEILSARLKEMQSSAANQPTALFSNIKDLPSDYITENMGGHCLVFLTPNLISESNLRLPKNLVSWDVAYDFYFDLIGKLTGSGRFHFFRINTAEALKGTWVRKQIGSSQRMQKLLEMAGRHRTLYESLNWKPCDGSQINFYSSMCSSKNGKAISRLKKFWESEASAVLDHVEFADFRARLSESDHGNTSFQWNIEHAAEDLFSQMWEQRKKVLSEN